MGLRKLDSAASSFEIEESSEAKPQTIWTAGPCPRFPLRRSRFFSFFRFPLCRTSRHRAVPQGKKSGSAERGKWLRHGGKRGQVPALQMSGFAAFQNLTQPRHVSELKSPARQSLIPDQSSTRRRFAQRMSRSPRPLWGEGRGEKRAASPLDLFTTTPALPFARRLRRRRTARHANRTR